MNPITIAAASDRGASLPRAERWRRALMRRLAWLTGLALVAGTLPAWQDRVPGETLRWMADLAVHWQWLYAAAGAAAGLVWLLLARGRGRAWAAALLLGLAVVAALNLTRWSLPRLPAANGAAGAPALRLLSFNVNLDNHRTADVLDWLDTQQADVLALLEVTPDMDGLLLALRARYPQITVANLYDHPRLGSLAGVIDESVADEFTDPQSCLRAQAVDRQTVCQADAEENTLIVLLLNRQRLASGRRGVARSQPRGIRAGMLDVPPAHAPDMRMRARPDPPPVRA